MTAPGKVRLTLDVSKALHETLGTLAETLGTTKAGVLRLAVALMEIAVEAKAKGQRVVLANEDGQVVTRIVL